MLDAIDVPVFDDALIGRTADFYARSESTKEWS